MKRRNLLPSVHVHPILLVFIVISFLTGTFTELMIILAIVLVHELGHFTAAKIFGWRVRGVMLWVFGGVMETDEYGTRPFHEELYVTLAGPFQHVLIYLCLMTLSGSQAILPSVIETAYFYNTVILLFNLLPVWPLDGGKLVFLLLSRKLPYRKSYDYTILFSLVLTIAMALAVLLLFPFTLSAFLLFSFLAMENRKDWQQRYYVFMRFLLLRYHRENHFTRFQSIEASDGAFLMDVFNGFYRDKLHIIYVTVPGDVRWRLEEMECLHSYFYDHHYRTSIGEIARHAL